MDLLNIFKSKEFENLFEKVLEEEMSKRKDENEIYNGIANHYFMLLSMLNVNSFSFFHFPDYEDCRKVLVDNKEYDFNNEFCHNDSDATEALCAIDCLIADLEVNDLKTLLKKIESTVNLQNTKMK